MSRTTITKLPFPETLSSATILGAVTPPVEMPATTILSRPTLASQMEASVASIQARWDQATSVFPIRALTRSTESWSMIAHRSSFRTTTTLISTTPTIRQPPAATPWSQITLTVVTPLVVMRGTIILGQLGLRSKTVEAASVVATKAMGVATGVTIVTGLITSECPAATERWR